MNLSTELIETRRLSEQMVESHEKIERAKRMKNYHAIYTILSMALAGICELMLLYPFEFIKSYSQFSPGISQYSVYHKPMRAAINYMKERGIKGFYIGSQPLMLATCMKAFCRMTTYDLTARQSTPESKRKWFRLYGFIATMMEMIIALPFENLKTHMAHSAYMRVLEPGHQTFVKLVETRGLKAFFRGFVPAFWTYSLMYTTRMMAFSVCLPIFDEWAAVRGKRLFDEMQGKVIQPEYEHLFRKKDGTYYEIAEYQYNRPLIGTIAIGTGSTLASVWLTMPLDHVKTKMQSPERPLYRGSLHCLTQSIKFYGIKSLWRGTTPRMIRAAIGSPFFITAYDMILTKFDSSGPHPCSDMGRLDL